MTTETLEYFEETLGSVCSPCELPDCIEWITEESNWAVFDSSNRLWIDTVTLRVISTKTLYQKYLDARESENNQL